MRTASKRRETTGRWRLFCQTELRRHNNYVSRLTDSHQGQFPRSCRSCRSWSNSFFRTTSWAVRELETATAIRHCLLALHDKGNAMGYSGDRAYGAWDKGTGAPPTPPPPESWLCVVCDSTVSAECPCAVYALLERVVVFFRATLVSPKPYSSWPVQSLSRSLSGLCVSSSHHLRSLRS